MTFPNKTKKLSIYWFFSTYNYMLQPPIILKKCFTTFLLSIIFLAILSCEEQKQTKKPNVLFILADDLGWTDLGCYGSSFYETPNLDKLAKSGALFTDAYAACPVCSPSRAAILSGKYPTRTKTTDWFGAPQPDAVGKHWTRKMPLLPANYTEYLDTAEVTLAEAFRNNDYKTFFAGKWHLGAEEKYWPLNQGFDVNIAGETKGNPGKGGYFSPYLVKNIEDGPEGEYLADRLAQETSDFISANQKNPFFAYLSFYLVHTPLEAKEALIAKYEAKKEKMGTEAIYGKERNQQVLETQSNPTYAAMVESMDAAIGKVLNTLDSLNLMDNTIIVFTSDNGGLSTSEGHPTSNLPLRAGKGWLYEGGIREPMIMHFPKIIPAGQKINQPTVATDFYSTLIDLTGIDAKASEDSKSLKPILEGKNDMRNLYWHYPHYGNQGGSPGSAVRSGDWKLIRWYTRDGYSEELYNLADDISEKTNLVESNSGKAMELKLLLDEWLDATNAEMPALNPGFKD